jgi:TRAP-type C4-dicarboxylate transport system permease small subunit
MKSVKQAGQGLDRALEGVERLGVLVGCVLIWGIFILIMLQMFGRVVLRVGLPWPEELARYFHIVLVFIGLAFAHRFRNHVDMQFFTGGLSPLVRRVVGILVELGIAVCSIVIVIGGWMLIARMGSQRSPALGLPLLYFVAPTVVGFGLLAIQAVRQLVLKFSANEAAALPSKTEYLEL